MIGFNVNVNIDESRINARLDSFKKKLYPAVKQQVYKGSMRYTPYLDGNLQDSADASSRDSTPQLVYNIVYARYQYYANGLAPNDFPGRTKETHPLASCLWIEKYMAAEGKTDIPYLCEHAPELLRF